MLFKMRTIISLSFIMILFMLATTSADNSNNTKEETKLRTKREPATIIRINHGGRPKKSYALPSRPKYGSDSHSYVIREATKSRHGPPKRKYGPTKKRPSKYGVNKPKYPSKNHGFKPSYEPPKYSSSYYGPLSEEDDIGFGEPPQSFGEPPQSFGEPPKSFGEPPVSTFLHNSGSFSGLDSASSYGSSFDGPLSEYDGASFSTSYKKYKRPSKKPYDFENEFKTTYGEDDSFDSQGFSSGTPFTYEPSRYEPNKVKKQKTKTNYNYHGNDAYSSQSITINKVKGHKAPPHDILDSYETHGAGYPDEIVPVSDFFGAPLSQHNTKYESFDDEADYDSFTKPETSFRRPVDEIIIRERPKKKTKVVKVINVRNIKKKPRTRQTDEGQIIFGGHYSEPPRSIRYPSSYSDVYDSTYESSNPAYSAVLPDTNYVNYKAANMGFSPQNVNDVFTANKRLEAGYQIELADNVDVQSQLGTIVAQSPNGPYYNRDRDHASEVKITKSLSHDYYAGTVMDPTYTSTQSPEYDSKHYKSSQDDILPPNYFDFSDAGLSEKTSQKFRDLASISLRASDNKGDTQSHYDDNIRNHRTQ